MIKCIEQLSKERINDISLLYFKHKLSVNQIMSIEAMSKNEVLAILNITRPYYKFSKKELASFSFSSPSFLVISDTHIGNENMKTEYIDEVYRFAKENSICHVFHAGDIIQSTVTGVAREWKSEEKQIKYVLDKYPKEKGVQTHFLLGNHDFKTIYKHEYYLDMLKSREDFNILGYKRCYLNWCKNLLSLNHDITNYRLKLPYISNTLLNFYGHRHDLLVKNNCIYLPTLSNDLKHYSKKEVTPGYIKVTLTNRDVIINHYEVFEKEKVICVNNGQILKRRIK